MIKYIVNIQVEAPTKGVANQKTSYLEQLSKLDIGSLKILAEKSNKKGIAQKLRAFQDLI